MLIQLPRGSADQQGSQNAETNNAFEAALRRDLASAPVVSYDAVLGGWSKRAVDLTLTLISAPVWLVVLLLAALVSKLRHSAPVFLVHERIGYGGRIFKCFKLRIDPPSAQIERLRLPGEPDEAPANDLTAIAVQAEGPQAKWRRALERLPQLFNVIAGDMALVGPSPLSREELEPLKTAKRYYLSARPGVIGVSAVVDADEEEASQYKAYTLAWSLTTDALILWDAPRSMRDRGELWKPGLKLAKARAAAGADRVVARKRSNA
ncbi:sugar transferase [Terricaulis sp.]|uniref:sugar transferase n=1 Tax=Terricaulis sp. TaxID=2768686 RepID=UPI002AC39DAC|nr:sugar transferase [Terricaulis sp.]MDZ4692007.1 sugar transferase [Terricaulis sp.]